MTNICTMMLPIGGLSCMNIIGIIMIFLYMIPVYYLTKHRNRIETRIFLLTLCNKLSIVPPPPIISTLTNTISQKKKRKKLTRAKTKLCVQMY